MNIALSGRIGSGKSFIARELCHHGYSITSFAHPIYRAAQLGKRFIETDDLMSRDVRDFLATLTDPETAKAMFKKWLDLVVENEQALVAWTPFSAKPRAFLQDFGQAFVALDETVWIRRVLETTSTGGPWVVDDLRMWYEACDLLDEGWMLVKVRLIEEVRLERVKSRYPDASGLDHVTEMDLDLWECWHYIFDGDGPKDTMPERVDDMLRVLRDQWIGRCH